MRLIDADALSQDLRLLVEAWSQYPHMAKAIKGVEVAIEYVENIPTAEPADLRGKHGTKSNDRVFIIIQAGF